LKVRVDADDIDTRATVLSEQEAEAEQRRKAGLPFGDLPALVDRLEAPLGLVRRQRKLCVTGEREDALGHCGREVALPVPREVREDNGAVRVRLLRGRLAGRRENPSVEFLDSF